ncbi:MAG: hypothetical protein JWO58_1144 [Chitinophagaceae bacterium]|nr:hypothetical protein [Chitinophagaceae bacterium]
MGKALEIDFYLLVGENKVSAKELLMTPQVLLDYYLGEEETTDSTFQGGYCISIDGKKWNGKEEFYFDLFAYTLNWLKGIEELLLKKQTSVDVGFWEESVAKATLLGNGEIEIMDATVNGRALTDVSRVDLQQFCKCLLQATQTYSLLAERIKELIFFNVQSIDEKKAQQIIQEMCADEFVQYSSSIEALMKER